jgi:hypothetical protein
MAGYPTGRQMKPSWWTLEDPNYSIPKINPMKYFEVRDVKKGIKFSEGSEGAQ